MIELISVYIPIPPARTHPPPFPEHSCISYTPPNYTLHRHLRRRHIRRLARRLRTLRQYARNGPLRIQQSELHDTSAPPHTHKHKHTHKHTSEKSRHTVSDGCAPTPSQYLARAVSSWMSFVGLPMPSAGGFGTGSYVPGGCASVRACGKQSKAEQNRPMTSRGRESRAVLRHG